MGMIWIKTDIGRAEIGMRKRVPERARRTLLLLIDGHRSQELLLNSVAGISAADFDLLAGLGLISRVDAAPVPGAAWNSPAEKAAASAASGAAHSELDVLIGERPTPGYAQLTARLTHLISSELGLRGFRLTLAVEKAADVAALLPIAERVVSDIAQRKGAAAAAKARQLIFSD
ncbi:MAG: hypothetical protein K2Q07_08590 [Burkholderiaceae bacterium]|nr:hypothetical protein [Burkholderiaceae bacterium]